MPIDIWSVLLGALVTTALGYVLYVKQRKDSRRDWHRNNQRDVDWQAQDFVIEVQAFASDPTTLAPPPLPGELVTIGRSGRIFDYTKSIQLIARANAFEARVADPALKDHIRQLNLELSIANHRGSFGRDNLGTVHFHCQRFYYRIGKLYADPDYRVIVPVVTDTRETSPETLP